jgi:hypothetical protein
VLGVPEIPVARTSVYDEPIELVGHADLKAAALPVPSDSAGRPGEEFDER